jgi:hypothetical protein
LGRKGFYILCIYSDASFFSVVNDTMNIIDPTSQCSRLFAIVVAANKQDGRANQFWKLRRAQGSMKPGLEESVAQKVGA